MKKFFSPYWFLLVICAVFPIIQAVADDVESESSEGIKDFTSLNLTISSAVEAKLTLSQSFALPILRGDHFLVSGNSLRFNFNTEMTSISMNINGEAVLTPIAFLQLYAGGMTGSGWIIDELFGNTIKGIGKNIRGMDGSSIVDGSAFDGVFVGTHAGGTLQFDMAAVFPGDWNHVVMQSSHRIGYKTYSRAAPGESWFFENDFGENQNGWNYYGSYLLGYQMPIFLNTIALLAEMNKYLYNTPGGDEWGDSLGRWDFSAVMNFTINKVFAAALITQFRTLRRYNNYAYSDDFDLYYRDRILDSGSKRSFNFYRVVVILQYQIR